MAHHKSAQKRIRQNTKRNARNRILRTIMRNHLKKFRALLEEQKIEEAQATYPNVQKVLDRSVTKGVLKKETASRYKSRLAHALLKASA